MTKTQAKILLYLILLTTGLTAGFFFSGLIHLALSGSFTEAGQLSPVAIIKGVMADRRQQMLFLAVEVIIATAITALFLMNKRESYESDTSGITDTIKTPIAIGQGQHGSARWLSKPEQRKAFSFYRLDPEDNPFKGLLSAGLSDRREVVDYKIANAKQAAAEASDGDCEMQVCSTQGENLEKGANEAQ